MTRLVAIKDLRTEYPGWVNPREFTGLSDKELDELAADIKTAGDAGEKGKIIDPPKVVQVRGPNGTIVELVIDGQRRVLAGSRVLPKHTEIEVVDLEDEPIDLTPEKADELMSKAIRMFHREGLSSYELSTVAERMRGNGRELADIARTLHRSDSWVSRMLKARSTASPKLLLAWRKAEITDEQFKDLASQKDKEAQDENTDATVENRLAGNKSEARSKLKELVESAKQKKAREKKEKLEAKAAEKAEKVRQKADAKQKAAEAKAAKKAGKNGKASAAPVVTGDQQDLWKPPAEKPKKPPAPNRVALEEIVSLAEKRPPTHEYVKGVIAGVRYALGQVELHELGKAWASWISRLGGSVGAKVITEPSKKVKAKARVVKAKVKEGSAKKRASKKRKADKVRKKR